MKAGIRRFSTSMVGKNIPPVREMWVSRIEETNPERSVELLTSNPYV